MDKKQKRRNELLNLVNSKERISIRELSGICKVSELTIRRDIQELEQQGFVQNIRGIVFANATKKENKIYNLTINDLRKITVRKTRLVCMRQG